jgi:RNA polymerase sigma-70 factor (sigma-E family)
MTHDRDAAFGEFVRSRQSSLLRFAWFVAGGSYASAEDLVQEALTRLYGRWRHVDDPEAYVRTAIVRLNVSAWRKVRREILTPVDRDQPAPQVDARGEFADLAAAVLDLPTRQRTAIVLRFWCDYDDRQAAVMLGCSPSTIRSNIHRALARLRETWATDAEFAISPRGGM